MSNTIQGQSLYPHQADFVKLYDKHKKGCFLVCKSCRQVGKSFLITQLALRECINNKSFKVIIVTPTFGQARKQFNEIEKMISPIPKLTKKINSSYLEITFYNGSTIKYLSAEQKDSARGFTSNLTIFDEAAFIPLDVASEMFNFTNSTNGNILLFSTPKLKDKSNLFYHFWEMGERGEPHIYIHDFNKYDLSVLLPPEKVEMYKKILAPQIFKSEILAEFITLENDLFGDFSKVILDKPLPTPTLYGGLDFATGSGKDMTALVVMNEDKQMCYLYTNKDLSPTDNIKWIVDKLKELPIKKLVCEVNVIGKVYYDMLRKEISKNNIKTSLIPFTTTNDSKREVIENLQVHINNQTCTLLDDSELKLQFASFGATATNSGKLTYKSTTESVNDDIVLATSFCLHNFKSGSYNIR